MCVHFKNILHLLILSQVSFMKLRLSLYLQVFYPPASASEVLGLLNQEEKNWEARDNISQAQETD